MDDWLDKRITDLPKEGTEELPADGRVPESPVQAGEKTAAESFGDISASEPAVSGFSEETGGFTIPEDPAGPREGFTIPEVPSDVREGFTAPDEPAAEPQDYSASEEAETPVTGFTLVGDPGEPSTAEGGSFASAPETAEDGSFASVPETAEGSAEVLEGSPEGAQSGGMPEAEAGAQAAPQRPYASPYDVYRFNGGMRPAPEGNPAPAQANGQMAGGPRAGAAEGSQAPAWRSQPVGGPYRQPVYGRPAGETPLPQNGAFAGGNGGGFGPGGPSDPSKPAGEPKKKGGTGKKVAAVLGIAALFGLVAALVFFGFTRLLGGILGVASVTENAQKQPEPPKFIIGSENRDDESSRQPAGRSDVEEKDNGFSTPSNSVPPEHDGEDLPIPDVVELVMPSMVAITNTSLNEYRSLFGERGQYENVSTGSGIIVGETETDYLIATNAHVIKNSEKLTVTFIDESVVEGTVSASDNSNDLAIVSVKKESIGKDTLPQIRIISIGNSDELRVGETVIAIGNSLGYGQSVSRGVVSALNRPVQVDNYATRELIQTDASINPGNSGGALINLRGELVGINEVKTVDTKVEGVGYAIPMSMAKPILENLGTKAARKKVDEANASYIGIHCMTMSNYYVQMGYPAGAYVSDVMKGGPAEAAGIVAGDIITAIDGSEVTSSSQLISYLEYYAAGEKVNFTIRRLNDTETAFDTKEIEITLGSKSDAVFEEPQGELG